MNRFKVGDYVQVINSAPNITIGKHYKLTNVKHYGPSISNRQWLEFLNDLGKLDNFHSSNFVIYKESNNLNVFTQSKHECKCDFHTVILRYGCQCKGV